MEFARRSGNILVPKIPCLEFDTVRLSLVHRPITSTCVKEFEPFLRPHRTPSAPLSPFNTFIRPLLPEMLYQSIDANIWPQDSNQSPRYLPNNSQAVLAKAYHPHPAPSPPNSRSPQYGKRCHLFSSSTKLCLYPIQSLSRESWSSGDTRLWEIEYTFVQNREHVARGGLSGLSSQLPWFVFCSIC